MKILIVDDSRTIRAALEAMVKRLGHEAASAGSGNEAFEYFVRERPDLILLDVTMQDMDGYAVARRLRTLCGDDWIPIIFLSGSDEDQDLDKAIDAGGDDYLVKPVSQVVLGAKIRAMQRIDTMHRNLARLSAELEAANRELARVSREDGLTRLANRRRFDEHLRTELLRAMRNGQPLSLTLCDVDHFKGYNDHYGHTQGDECLRQVGQILRQSCRRPADLAARYGGGVRAHPPGHAAPRGRGGRGTRAKGHRGARSAACGLQGSPGRHDQPGGRMRRGGVTSHARATRRVGRQSTLPRQGVRP